jgi:hypothetical protein
MSYVIYVQVGNVNSIYAGMLRAGLPALLLQLVALLSQTDGALEASSLLCPPFLFSLPYHSLALPHNGAYSLHVHLIAVAYI